MYAKIDSISVQGVEGVPVEVEVNLGKGLASYITVGLPDAAIKESRDRIISALANNNYSVFLDRAVVNLAPADLKKEGVLYDLPIALGAMIAKGDIVVESAKDYLVVGELSLDGRVRPCKGILCATITAKKLNKKAVIIPFENANEASVVDGILIYAVKDFNEAISALKGEFQPFVRSEYAESTDILEEDYALDFEDVKGQELVKRAITIASAGGHNLLMLGPPGSGKSMIAKRIPSILPDMSREEAIETTKIHSIAGMLDRCDALMSKRPYRAPHHTISNAGLIGGGSHPRPGEVSLSHNGVLFLDELPEFNRTVLEVLRQPLEDGKVNITRAACSMTFPSELMLIAAMNPCPCGYFGHPTRRCSCSTTMVSRYMNRISGPLLDRIDLHISVPAVEFKDVVSTRPTQSSKEMKKKVDVARKLQLHRFKGQSKQCNAFMNEKMLKKYCGLTENASAILELGMKQLGFSARSYSRILKVSRTIADLSGSDGIESQHITEALNYRSFDQRN